MTPASPNNAQTEVAVSGPLHRRAPGRWGRRVGKILAWSLLALLLITGVAVIYSNTNAGHRTWARALERLVSEQIPGRVSIGEFRSFGFFEPELHDVQFIHPNGTVMLQLDRAKIDLDVGAAFHGKLGFNHAETSGGKILLSSQPDGRLGLEAALDWPTPGTGTGTGNPEDGFHYRLRSMHVQDLTVVIRVGSDKYLRLLHTRGFVGVTRETTPGVIVDLERIQGTLDRELLGAKVAIQQLDGAITGKQQRIADLKLKLTIGEKHMTAQLRAFDREKTPVELNVKTDGSVATELAGLGLKLGSWFTDAVRVEWD